MIHDDDHGKIVVEQAFNLNGKSSPITFKYIIKSFLMIIKSKRLEIRFVNISDLKSIHSLLILPETDKFNTLGLPKNLEVTKSFLDDWMKLMQKE